AVMDHGALAVHAMSTHPVLSGPAVQRITDSPLGTVIVTDSIPLSAEAAASGKFEVVSVASIFAEAIRAIHHHDSISRLFD
ncbi:MAG: phosphoribosylpyrophosphate synthetase, partial [Myxococcota bacterium]|nr:phosphoribosylpyrophosphate synthetase [Myxococcota bacterium]